MEKKVNIIRHVDCEGAGYLLTVLKREKIPYVLINVDEGDSIPSSTNSMLALVSMGGGMSANDDLAWISREIALMQQAEQQNIPVLGHCLGAQLMAKALGGTVYANAYQEIGWFDVVPQNNEASAQWLGGLPSFPDPMSVFHWHGETFSLPEGAQTILSSEHSVNQCFVKDNMLGFQCHIEMTEPQVVEWVARFAAQLSRGEDFVQTAEQIMRDLPQRIKELNDIADVIYRRWIKTFKPGG